MRQDVSRIKRSIVQILIDSFGYFIKLKWNSTLFNISHIKNHFLKFDCAWIPSHLIAPTSEIIMLC